MGCHLALHVACVLCRNLCLQVLWKVMVSRAALLAMDHYRHRIIQNQVPRVAPMLMLWNNFAKEMVMDVFLLQDWKHGSTALALNWNFHLAHSGHFGYEANFLVSFQWSLQCFGGSRI
jgi:hypothetical protein